MLLLEKGVYRQNILLYVKNERLKSLPNLNAEYERTRQQPLSLVHPAIYRAPSVKTLLRMFPHALISAVRRRLKRFECRPGS